MVMGCGWKNVMVVADVTGEEYKWKGGIKGLLRSVKQISNGVLLKDTHNNKYLIRRVFEFQKGGPAPAPTATALITESVKTVHCYNCSVKEFATWISQSISKLIPEKPFVIKLLLKVYAYVK
ncbi:hypothetical protein HanPI659440_Chr01g0028941 [Helianthus annuus]|nr:hypothetical protein HanPI659440_Chr01g0028941 [Helianthus annuus]